MLELKPRVEENLRSVESIEILKEAGDLLALYSMALLIWRETIKSSNPNGTLKIDEDERAMMLSYGLEVSVDGGANYIIDGNKSVSSLFGSSAEKLKTLEGISLPEDARPWWKKVLPSYR